MTGSENFLSRWSRRKQEVAEQEAKLETPVDEPEKGRGPPATPIESSAEASIDLTKLPSLDEITADTDIAAFLKPGVPNDLARAALRRAWASDPAVRDFVGLQENDWVFNKPGAAEGFGPLGPEHDVGKLLARVFGEPPTEETAAQSEGTEVTLAQQGQVEATAAPSEPAQPERPEPKSHDAAHNKEPEQSPRRSPHGGALPRPISET